MNQKHVFITGIAGFLGSHLADRFLAEGWIVSGCDNLSGGYRDNPPAGASFHIIDCNDFSSLASVMEGVDVVYHCAASAYEGLSVFSPHFVTQNIVTATSGAIAAALRCEVQRFVFCSSMARYGRNSVPFTEDMTPCPQDPYGIGKRGAELLLENLARTHGMDWVVAVPHNIIGPRQRYDDPYRNVASIFINLMLQGRQPFIYGDGEQKRCFSFVSDVVDPLFAMATDARCVGEVINIGPDGEFVTINQLAVIIARLLDFELDPQRLPPRPCEVMLANCSAGKARRLFGYEPRVSLEQGLAVMIDWMKQRGVRPFQHHAELEIASPLAPKTWSQKLL